METFSLSKEKQINRTSGADTRSTISKTIKKKEGPGMLENIGEAMYKASPISMASDFSKDVIKGTKNLVSDFNKAEEGSLVGVPKEDLGLAGKITQNFQTAQEGIKEAKTSEVMGKQSGFTSLLEGMGLLAGATSDTIGDVFISGLSTITPEETEQLFKQGIQKAAETKGGEWLTGQIQEAEQGLEYLRQTNPDKARKYEAFIGGLKGAAELAGFGTIKKGANLLETGIETGAKQLDNTIQAGVQQADVLKQNILKGMKPIQEGVEQTGDNLLTKINEVLSKEGQGQDAIGNILQGETRDIKPGVEAFKEVDTAGVKTYKDLQTKFGTKLNDIIKTQDELLEADGRILNIEDATKTISTSKGNVVNNPVRNAIDDIDNIIVQTGEDLYTKQIGNSTLGDITNRIKNGEGTIKDYNDLARYYNGEFNSKIYTKKGDAKDSVIADRYENNRKGIKNFVRDNLPDDTMKQLDTSYSNVVSTKRLIDDAVEKVNRLEQKLKNAGIGYGVGRFAFGVLDKATGGALRFFRDFFRDSNLGNKISNWSDLQNDLKKNLAIVNKALNKNQKTRFQKVDEKLGKATFVKDKIFSGKPKPIVIKKSDVKPEMLALPPGKIVTPQTIKKGKAIERKQNKQGIKIKEKTVIEESKKDIKNTKFGTIDNKANLVSPNSKALSKEVLTEYEKYADDIYNDVKKLGEEEYYKKYGLYPNPMKNSLKDFNSNWSKWRAFSDFDAKQEAISNLPPKLREITQNILKEELGDKIKDGKFKIYRIGGDKGRDVSYTINPNIKLPGLVNHNVTAYEIGLRDVKYYDFIGGEGELVLNGLAVPKILTGVKEIKTTNGLKQKEIATSKPQNVSNKTSNGIKVKKETSSERVSRLIQEAKDKQGIKPKLTNEIVKKKAIEISKETGLKCENKLCGLNATKQYLQDGGKGKIDGGIFVEKLDGIKTKGEAIKYTKEKSQSWKNANKKGDVVHIWYKNKDGKILGDEGFTKGKQGFYISRNDLK